MYRLKGQKSHFPLNCLLVPRKDGGSPKNNNYSIIQSSSHQNIFFFWFPCGVGFFLVLWCGIISNRTLLWSYVNRTAFFKRRKLHPTQVSGITRWRHCTAQDWCGSLLQGFGIPTATFYGRCCYSLSSPHTLAPRSFPILSCPLSCTWPFPQN